jgi:hypothetical protein
MRYGGVRRLHSVVGFRPPVGRDWGKLDLIGGDPDINRPFRVRGTFEDAELIRIVNLLRSGPAAPLPRGGSASVEVLPILSVQRQSSTTVSVILRRQIQAGQTVTLEKRGEDWVVASVRNWIA